MSNRRLDNMHEMPRWSIEKFVSIEKTQPLILETWRAVVASVRHLYRVYQSPGWAEHLSCCGDDSVGLAVLRKTGVVAAVVPFKRITYHYQSRLGKLLGVKHKLQAIAILGGFPLGVGSVTELDSLFAALLGEFPDIHVVFLKSVIAASAIGEMLDELRCETGAYWVVTDGDRRPLHYVVLPESFAEYVGKFSGKTRSTLRRKVRLVEKRLRREVRLVCSKQGSDIDSLLSAIASVEANAREFHEHIGLLDCPASFETQLRDLGDKGLLRSYTLFCGDEPLAYVLGIVFEDVFHYSDIAFDTRYDNLSPGTVLLFLLIEDLVSNTQIRNVNFGIGDAEYKRIFGNAVEADVGVFVMRKCCKSLCVKQAIGLERLARRIVGRFRKDNGSVRRIGVRSS